MFEVEICIGASGSGKSTYAENKVVNDNTWFRINRDNIRYMLSGVWFKPDMNFEKQVTKVFEDILIRSFKLKQNIIIDNTNLDIKYINQFKDTLQLLSTLYEVPIRITYKVFDVDMDVCIERDMNRERSVGKEVIQKQYKSFLNIKQRVKHNQVDMIFPTTKVCLDTTLPEVIICDLDGTLADNKHRCPFDYSKCDEDSLIGHVDKVLRLWADIGGRIIYLSGRDESAREKTMTFLHKHDCPSGQLLMRNLGDNRKDAIVKEEILREHILPTYNVVMALDDRLSVCCMWSAVGIPVLRNGNPLLDF